MLFLKGEEWERGCKKDFLILKVAAVEMITSEELALIQSEFKFCLKNIDVFLISLFFWKI